MFHPSILRTRAPHLQSPKTALPPVIPAASDGERVFFNEGGITVTSTRFMVYSQTFAVANISSVELAEVPQSVAGWVVLAIFGGLVALYGIAAIVQFPAVGIVFFLIGGVAASAGILGAAKQKSYFIVALRTSAGEIKTCQSKDEMAIRRIVAALNQAIVARG